MRNRYALLLFATALGLVFAPAMGTAQIVNPVIDFSPGFAMEDGRLVDDNTSDAGAVLMIVGFVADFNAPLDDQDVNDPGLEYTYVFSDFVSAGTPVEVLVELDEIDLRIAGQPGARVVLVDDASTDPRVAPILAGFASRGEERHVLTLAENRGFVHAANRGMAAATGHPVLLNSDTVVTHGWLEALAQCLASDARIATATPWSNNAEIVSVPRFCAANPVPDDAQAWADAARASATASLKRDEPPAKKPCPENGEKRVCRGPWKGSVKSAMSHPIR